jgi:hypothetical protein
MILDDSVERIKTLEGNDETSINTAPLYFYINPPNDGNNAAVSVKFNEWVVFWDKDKKVDPKKG